MATNWQNTHTLTRHYPTSWNHHPFCTSCCSQVTSISIETCLSVFPFHLITSGCHAQTERLLVCPLSLLLQWIGSSSRVNATILDILGYLNHSPWHSRLFESQSLTFQAIWITVLDILGYLNHSPWLSRLFESQSVLDILGYLNHSPWLSRLFESQSLTF